ncbi:hypothetical protein VKT23_020092 [Stygiomarasmius scandens]|uniref:DUF6606 domain-containing protein n=1 Tax=Marasmiellus scandens TaxID=2682957 RepID=A0ABR1IJQ8_9AGAR
MSSLDYTIHHVFMPPKLPQKDDYTAENEEALCQTVHWSAVRYALSGLLEPEHEQIWSFVVKMLSAITQSQAGEGMSMDTIEEKLMQMQEGSTLAYLIRAQNAGVVFRKSVDQVIVASFEVSPPAKDVIGAQGKLSCTYPGPAIAVPAQHFEDADFVHELASFLVQMDTDGLDSTATTKKAGSTVVEERETSSPRYITALLTGILRGIGSPADIVRIRKRIGDDVLWKDARLPWRRSMVWLVIRVAMQLHLSDTPHYKLFMAFLMSDVLFQGVKAGLDSDTLHSMCSKLGTRISKLGPEIPNALMKKVKWAAEKANDLLQSRWNSVMKEDAQHEPWDPKILLALKEKDCVLTLPNSRKYIQDVLNRVKPTTSLSVFTPDTPSRPLRNIRDFGNCSIKVMQQAFAVDPSIALADLEESIENHLYRWINEHLLDTATPVILLNILKEYLAAAKKFYRFQEDNSIMILTLFETWVALDAVTVSTYPLLSLYSPEIPLTLFEPLLLRKSSDINRLIDIHQYILSRHDQASLGTVFTDVTKPSSFAVRFFDSSPELQFLKNEIEKDAHLTRERRRQEYLKKRQEYRDKKAQAEALVCVSSGRGPKKHAKGEKQKCPKCILNKAAKKLEIEIHEWPLPRDANAAKATVFELNCPQTFAIWRDATCILLRDVCKPQKDHDPSANPVITLDKYVVLSGWKRRLNLAASVNQRISIASTTKSFLNSHYSKIKLSKAHSENHVLVDNALSYKLYDSTSNAWVANSFQNLTINPWCRPEIPASSPYAILQSAVESTSYSPNALIADQNLCHDSLGVHEFFAFGSVRGGEYLQWPNIAKEIRARVLSFHTEDTYLLLTQSARQIGSISRSGDLEWHMDLHSPPFCHTLLSELENLLHDVKSSWMEATSVRSIIALCARVLATTEDQNVQLQGYRLMRLARNVTYSWMKSLSEELQSRAVETNSESLDVHQRLGKICEIALTCRSTYDVDGKHMNQLLTSPDDVAIFVECSIQIFNNTPSSHNELPEHVQRLLQQNERLSHCTELHLSSLIRGDKRGMDRAIASVWPAYIPGPNEPWIHMPISGTERWLRCSTNSTPNSSSHYLHFDVLTGRLLIDGKNWNRLPPAITNHSSFRRIFGSHVFEVAPSNIRGLEFVTRFPFAEYQVDIKPSIALWLL